MKKNIHVNLWQESKALSILNQYTINSRIFKEKKFSKAIYLFRANIGCNNPYFAKRQVRSQAVQKPQ